MRPTIRGTAARRLRSTAVVCTLLLSSNANADSCSERIPLLQARVDSLLARQARTGIRGPEGTFTALGLEMGSTAPARSEPRQDGQGRGSKILI